MKPCYRIVADNCKGYTWTLLGVTSLDLAEKICDIMNYEYEDISGCIWQLNIV